MFLNDPSSWPVDLSGKYVFLVKAVADLGRKITLKEAQLPTCLYRYDQDLPTFKNAKNDDKNLGANIIRANCTDRSVRTYKLSYYRNDESHEDVCFEGTQDDWDFAQYVSQCSRSVSHEAILNSVSMALGIFAGVAGGRVKAYVRNDGWDYQPLPANKLNLSNPEIVKARLALGRIDPANPTSLDPRGAAEIFFDVASYESWYKAGGLQDVMIRLAMNVCMRIAKQYPETLPEGFGFENIKKNFLKPFRLTIKSEETLWDLLPNTPFKLPGRR